MLVHAISECFNLSSLCSSKSENQQKSSNDQKYRKFDSRNQEQAKIRDIMLVKQEDSRIPILSFRDYFTLSQINNHNMLFPGSEEKRKGSPEIVKIHKIHKISNLDNLQFFIIR